jgi:hypothetical protein
MSPPAPTIPGGGPPRRLGIGAASTTCARLAGNVLWSIVLIKVTPSVVAH